MWSLRREGLRYPGPYVSKRWIVGRHVLKVVGVGGEIYNAGRKDRRRLLLERQINLLAHRRGRRVRNDPRMSQERLLYEGLPGSERGVEHAVAVVVQPENLESQARAVVDELYCGWSAKCGNGLDVPFVAARLGSELLVLAKLDEFRRGLHPGIVADTS